MAALALTGCRTDAPEPGVGVQVGDRAVSLDDVDRTARALCAASLPELQEIGRVLPMAAARSRAAAITADRLRAEELAAEFDVRAGGETYSAVRLEADGFGDLPDDLRDSFVDAASTAQLVQDVALEVGRLDLAAQGLGQGQAAAEEDEAALNRGLQLFAERAAEQEIRFDPRLGVSLEDGEVVQSAHGTSVAASQWSLAALDPEAETFGVGLPDNQTCG